MAATAALAADPDDVQLLRLLALAQSDGGAGSTSIDTARRAIALQPEDPRGYRVLGSILYDARRYEESVEQFRHGLALAPQDASLHAGIVEPLLKTARRVGRRPNRPLLDEATRHADEVLRVSPSWPEGHLLLAKIAAMRRDTEGIRAHSRQALERDPNNALGRQLLGLAAELDGDVTTAASHYVEAGRTDPQAGNSMALLRRLKVASPLGAIAGLVVLRVMIGVGGAVAGALGALVLVVSAIVVYVLVQRRRTRARLTDEARQVLERDRQLRSRRFRRS